MAFNAFLKIDGIQGESQSQPGAIPLESYSWGLSNPSTIGSGTGGAGGGKVSFQDFSFTALAGKQSPQLFENAAKGKNFSNATLTVQKSHDDRMDLLTITFKNIIISSYKLDEGGLPAVQLGAPMESVSFNFESLTFKADGFSGSGGVNGAA